ncbi:MAG: DNA methyltransferase [Cyanobacteria bacterium P01_D01_bin.56]
MGGDSKEADSELLELDLGCKARNQLSDKDQAVHHWYRFVLSFPPHLVRHYLKRFSATTATVVLDPFAGTGTTLVEAKKLGIPVQGIEANPMAHFASSVKLNWSASPQILLESAQQIATAVEHELALLENLAPTLPTEAAALLLKNAISPRPLQKVLTLLGAIDRAWPEQSIYWQYQRLAVANAAILGSNLRFAPEVGVSRKHKSDAPVIALWLDRIESMVQDLVLLEKSSLRSHPGKIHLGDARQPHYYLAANSVDVVITSPPYPNEKDYTRTTRLESVLLGFLENKAGLKAVKHDLLRSNSRGVYSDDTDDQWIQPYPHILELARTINKRREELGKTSGFSRLYARATTLYFGGMARHLANLRAVLRPGAQLAYVVGEQASYLQVHIPTGSLLADIAKDLGYQVMAVDLFRTRRASKTDVDLREEVVVLRWPGAR